MDDGGGVMISWEVLSLIKDLGNIDTYTPCTHIHTHTYSEWWTSSETHICILWKWVAGIQISASLHKLKNKQWQVDDLLKYLALCNLLYWFKKTTAYFYIKWKDKSHTLCTMRKTDTSINLNQPVSKYGRHQSTVLNLGISYSQTVNSNFFNCCRIPKTPLIRKQVWINSTLLLWTKNATAPGSP